MSNTITTLAQKLEKGYMKIVRFDTDKILYVSGKKKKIENALDFPCDTPEAFSGATSGGKGIFLRMADVKRLQKRSDKKTIDIGFNNEKGKSCTIDIEANNKEIRDTVFDEVGSRLNKVGLNKSDRKASAFSVSWGPIFLMLITGALGGLLTMAQASGDGIEMDESSGGGRSARKARGLRVLIVSVSNMLGFWGCLAVTVAILLACLLYWFSRLKNRPVISVWS